MNTTTSANDTSPPPTRKVPPAWLAVGLLEHARRRVGRVRPRRVEALFAVERRGRLDLDALRARVAQ